MPVTWQRRQRTQWMPTGKRETHQDYYAIRCMDTPVEDYWAPKCDPDGVLRDRNTEAERQSYLQQIDEELTFIRSLGPGRIVDVGCGLGWLLDELLGWERVGVETSEIALTALQAKGIHCVQSVQRAPWQWADVVMCHHVIEHIPDPLEVIYAIKQRLKQGGWLILGTPDFDSPCAKRFGANYRMLHDPTHCSLFTNESMHRFLRDFGFAIRDVQYPFPDRYATAETFARWHDTTKTSPPWPGNWMTYYAQRAVE